MAEEFYTTLEEVHFPYKNYVLVLPGWYPTNADPYPGDFNQRHVMAAGLYTPQVVLYIAKNQTETIHVVTQTISKPTDTVLEIKILYPKKKNRYWDVIHSNFFFLTLLLKHAQIIKQKLGIPRLLHAYIVIRGGAAAWVLSKKWKVPFILTENWTIYYREDPGYIKQRNFLFRLTVRKIFKNVKRFLPVTQDLNKQVQQLFGAVPATIIPNVVDTDLFFYTEAKAANEPFRFIHVSTMTYQKNPEGLLRAFKPFHASYPNTSLLMVGPYPKEVLAYAQSLGLDAEIVNFTGEVKYEQVASWLKESNALVLFSRYENLPCVILEALCCGVPVISTNAGGIAEVINDSNGIIIFDGKEEQLQEALEQVYNTYLRFNRVRIAEVASKKFSYTTVGNEIDKVYKELIS
ncbi:MAG: glycosyltransferase [Segetibacter sp.]